MATSGHADQPAVYGGIGGERRQGRPEPQMRIPRNISCLDSVPPGAMCATSTLGCASTESELDLSFAEKLFAVRPGKLLLYGKHDPIMEHQADMAGVSYKTYPDAHALYKRRDREPCG
ncbi:hypothetical protein [Bifidobacterium moukalabense]|uniref:hypothetical protein n=1 Tax=Bifidobacterium moukalabense TaxID=1333651 RepID=UPI001FCE3145|nr:hypothetical protein [Bifidobacterium moukalabense]